MTAREVATWLISRPAANRAEPLFLANLNLHGLYVQEKDDDFRSFTASAARVLIDGWPVLALAGAKDFRLFRPKFRVGSTDWLDELLRQGGCLSIVSVGGEPEVAARIPEVLASRLGSNEWHSFDGFVFGWRASSNGSEIDLTEALQRADLVLVGMGMPRQEEWILRHAHLSPGAVLANVGGCLDYYAGTQTLAPRWIGSIGIEWLYRLIRSPRRLFRRYIIEPVELLGLTVYRLFRNRIGEK